MTRGSPGNREEDLVELAEPVSLRTLYGLEMIPSFPFLQDVQECIVRRAGYPSRHVALRRHMQKSRGPWDLRRLYNLARGHHPKPLLKSGRDLRRISQP